VELGDCTFTLRQFEHEGRQLFISATPVTHRQWNAVMGVVEREEYSSLERPITLISRDAADLFCGTVSRYASARCELPTYETWKAAASKLSHDVRVIARHSLYAWHRGNCEKLPQVAEKLPNAIGVYDMLGCVWEWCADNSLRPGSGIVAGGSWEENAHACSPNSTVDLPTGTKSEAVGFRFVVNVPSW